MTEPVLANQGTETQPFWQGRCSDCGAAVIAADYHRAARCDAELPAHAIVEGEAECGCRVELHAGHRDGPGWWRLWALFRYGPRWARILVRCADHGGRRLRLRSPWRDERDARDGRVGGT